MKTDYPWAHLWCAECGFTYKFMGYMAVHPGNVREMLDFIHEERTRAGRPLHAGGKP